VVAQIDRASSRTLEAVNKTYRDYTEYIDYLPCQK